MPRRYFSNIPNEKRYESRHKEIYPDVRFERIVYRGITILLSIPRFFAKGITKAFKKSRDL
jgi:hypothetical protein